VENFDEHFGEYDEMISIDALTVRDKETGELKQVKGGEECFNQVREAYVNGTTAAAVKLLSELQDEIVELHTRLDEQAQLYGGLVGQIDEYLCDHALPEIVEAIEQDIDAGDERVLMLVDSLADLQGVSQQDMILRAAEKARANAINPYADPGAVWSQGVPDGSAAKNRASIHRAGRVAPATGNSGGGLKEHVEVDPRVEVYCRYMDNQVAMGGGLLSGKTKIYKFPNKQQSQQLSEELEEQRETVNDIIETVTEGMSEQKTEQLLSEVGDLEFDENQPERLEEQLREKRHDQEAFDRKMQVLNAFERRRALGLICR
jgi:hypothetical protein